MTVICPIKIDTKKIEILSDVWVNEWEINKEFKGYDTKEIINNLVSYKYLKKFANEHNCNGVILLSSFGLDSDKAIKKYFKVEEERVNGSNNFLYEINYGFDKYKLVSLVENKFETCAIINFEPISSKEDSVIENKKKYNEKVMRINESRDTILDDEFYTLVDEGYIYDEDENGMNMSYGEYSAVSDDLWEVLENELKYYRDFPTAYEEYKEIIDNTSDDAKMFMGISDDEYFYFEINEDEGTYSFSGEVPSVLEKLFKEFQKETDLIRV